jgi:hypothetical protein
VDSLLITLRGERGGNAVSEQMGTKRGHPHTHTHQTNKARSFIIHQRTLGSQFIGELEDGFMVEIDEPVVEADQAALLGKPAGSDVHHVQAFAAWQRLEPQTCTSQHNHTVILSLIHARRAE